MEKKSRHYVRISLGVLVGSVSTALFSSLMSFLAEYIMFDSSQSGGGVIHFERGFASFLVGFYGAILGIFGGAILGGVISGISLGKGKSTLIGGSINGSILFLFAVMLGAGQDAQGKDMLIFLIWIAAQAIAGGIAGFLVSLILDSTDKDQKENYE